MTCGKGWGWGCPFHLSNSNLFANGPLIRKRTKSHLLCFEHLLGPGDPRVDGQESSKGSISWFTVAET